MPWPTHISTRPRAKVNPDSCRGGRSLRVFAAPLSIDCIDELARDHPHPRPTAALPVDDCAIQVVRLRISWADQHAIVPRRAHEDAVADAVAPRDSSQLPPLH